MIPNATVTKNDGGTGVVRPGAKGICAIIAPSSAGTVNQPAAYTKPSLALNDLGYGMLTDFASYIMAVAGNPVVLVKGTASTPGAYGAVVHTGAGTSVVTATVGTPNDDYNARIRFILPGTIGVAGITYVYSLDGGLTESAAQALGTANTIVIPNSGVTFSLGAGTVLAGQLELVPCTGPRMTTSDVSAALDALRTSSQPWEMVFLAGHDCVAATITLIDTWLAAREAEGRYRAFVANTVFRTSAQTEAQYATALDTALTASATIRGAVGADGGDCVSTIPGRAITQKRPTALALTARLMDIDYGVDAAYVSLGPVPGFALADSKGNPNNHDENLYPGLDALRFATLRTFDRKSGTFITNPNVLSTQGSDFVWMQHVRTMNRACEIAYDVLTQQLSRGINKSPKAGPNGEIFIAEEDAQRIEALVNQALYELRGQVSDLLFSLSRTDNIGSNGPVTLNGAVKIAALAYVKQFNTNASFVRTISVQQ
jgi:hypothetical protein